MSKLKGFPKDPVRNQRAQLLLTHLRQCVAAEHWKDAAPLSLELVNLAPDLAEAHALMGQVALATNAFDIAEQCFARALKLGPITGARLQLQGKSQIALGRLVDAESTLRRAQVFSPKDTAILCDLADTLIAQHRPDEALPLFRTVVKHAPDHSYAKHMVAALTGDTTSDADYVKNLFNSYAPIFDEHLTGALHYHAPSLIAEALTPLRPNLGTVLDLGCGTGLVAAALNGRFSAIDGIDLADQMLSKARARGLYRSLHQGDLLAVLTSGTLPATSYDLIAAADVLIYLRDLQPLFTKIAATLAPDGIFAFTTETTPNAPTEVMPSGRFAHAPSYIAELAQNAGLRLHTRQSAVLRQEYEKPIEGELYLLTL